MIMIKKLAIVICVIFSALVLKAEDGKKIDSKVQKVLVFLNGAQVTRTASVTIGRGTSTLIFTNISPDIDPQSIQVRANGAFTILSVKNELDFINEQTKQKQVEELLQHQEAINNKIATQNSLISVYTEEQNMLIKNQVVSGQNTNLDVLKLKQALDFQTERLIALKQKQQVIRNQISALEDELGKYNRQIADVRKGSSTATNNIIVTVSAKAELQTEFTINYVVKNANWFPTYDIRAKNINSPISIAYKANVSQNSGEDWKNIKLTLSTGNPTVSGSKPELNPYYLNFGMLYSNQADKITRVTGRVIGEDDNSPIQGVTIKVKGTSIATQTRSNGEYSIEVPAGNPTLVYSLIGYVTAERAISSSVINVALKPTNNQLAEVVVAKGLSGKISGLSISSPYTVTELNGYQNISLFVNQVENQTNVEFDIENPYSIPSDGKPYTVEINQVDVDALYQYAVAPKLSTDVFLTAKLIDWNKYNFLSGEASLFFEGTFIGKSLLNVNATADTLNISLGADKNIIVTRTSLKELKTKHSIGSNKKEIRDWQIEIKNRKNQQINLLVEDQVPVSQNTSIEVENQELSGGKLDANTGKVTWEFVLKPQESKKLELKYQVKYPKGESVIVQ